MFLRLGEAQMAQEFKHYDAVIADLKAKRDQLSAMIDTLEHMKGMGVPYVGSTGSDAPRVASGAGEIPHDAFFGMTIPEAAKKYLAIVKHTVKHPVLCDAILAGGFTTSSPNFREVVRSTLGRQPDFVKIRGQWGLKEWYGTRGKRKSKRGTSANSNPLQSLLPEGRHEDEDDEYGENEGVEEGKKAEA
jgi:hypothetical protein